MAKATPRTSDDGSLNPAKMNPPVSTRRPSMSGAPSRISSPISDARWNSTSSGNSMVAKAIFPACGPSDAICRSPPSAYGLWTRSTSSIAATRSNTASMAERTAGSSTPCSARNTMVPDWPVPWPPKDSSRMSNPSFDSTSGRLKSSRKAFPTAPDSAPPNTRTAIHAARTTRRRSWQRAPSRAKREVRNALPGWSPVEGRSSVMRPSLSARRYDDSAWRKSSVRGRGARWYVVRAATPDHFRSSPHPGRPGAPGEGRPRRSARRRRRSARPPEAGDNVTEDRHRLLQLGVGQVGGGAEAHDVAPAVARDAARPQPPPELAGVG
jgi:hypothetical protein